MITHRRHRLGPVVGLLLLVLAGCATGSPFSNSRPAAYRDQAANFQSRAKRVVADWNKHGRTAKWLHGFVPLQVTEVRPAGAIPAAVSTAIDHGYVTLGTALPTTTPAPAAIRFPDGATMTVPLRTAAQAFQNVGFDPADCTGTCAPIKVTAVRLGTMPMATSRGRAIVPAWLFTVPGLTGPIASLAVAKSATSEPPLPTIDFTPTDGVTSAQDIKRVDGRTITFDVGIGECEKDAKPLIYETATVVALGGSVQSIRPTGPCADVLLFTPVTVTLRARSAIGT